ncbi:hypothetical protein [Pseudactinotalea sp. Z1748]|uniref:hypothetical protein n=1 Tax=Pseudactinotalea sp. Z1748 TaxID=3413027 RepID=UPI003C7CBFCE
MKRRTWHWQVIGLLLIWSVVLGAVALTSCTTSSTGGGRAAGSTPTPSERPAPASDDHMTGPDHAPHDHAHDHGHDHGHERGGAGEPMHDMERANPGVGEHPSWEEDDQLAALERGREAMEAFARPEMAQVQWLEEMLVYVAPRARENFAHIDPASITATEVKDVDLAQVSTASMAQVIAETDGHDYVVTMTRLAVGQPWLVERINLDER